MGPRFLDRGESKVWKTAPHRSASFNGAAVFGPRRAYDFRWNYAGSQPLQWGRGFWTAESFPAETSERAAKALQWGRGFWTAESMLAIGATWATTTLQWGRGFWTAESTVRSDLGLAIGTLQWGRGFW